MVTHRGVDTTQEPVTAQAEDVELVAQLRHSPLREAALLAGLFVLYSLTRLVASDDLRVALLHARDVLHLERLLHLDVESSLNLALSRLPMVEVAASYWYAVLHYLVTPAVLVLVYRFRPAHYRSSRTALVVATGAALACYLAFPTAPPRFVVGYTDVLARTAEYGWWAGQGAAIKGAAGMVNQLAAMPSMHVGWAVWCALALSRMATARWQRVLVWSYPTVTFLVVVATANHWFLDAVAGAALVAITWVLTHVGPLASRSARA
ncbi:MAG TPA: phosphatase PAP2 family protein [Nocardioides sp.]|uniref:phosphatase PAP2 family protein n=1 Tax=Nocardioides sp. TaxID=35761 RepID=UPI002D054BC5|nr:phosphatase PAP2 family protein [Nocardioides sp.]HQR27229.1 phosphatase PAP2 family protein [Nocardioides sp.]